MLSNDSSYWCADGVDELCRLVVMSATLGGGLAQELAGLMKPQADLAGAAGTSHPGSSSSSSSNVPVIISEGRSFPVTTHFLGKPCEHISPDAAVGHLLQAWQCDSVLLVQFPTFQSFHIISCSWLWNLGVPVAAVQHVCLW